MASYQYKGCQVYESQTDPCQASAAMNRGLACFHFWRTQRLIPFATATSRSEKASGNPCEQEDMVGKR
jgi:hypothetical protein